MSTSTRFDVRTQWQVLNTDLERGTFEGYASVFGSLVDTYPPTIVERGAFAKTLAEGAARVRVLYQHDPRALIGRPLVMREDRRGLFIRGKISETELGREALTLMRDGVLSEMSIGFDAVRWEMRADAAAPTDPSRQVRHLLEVRLWEISLVTWAADPQALVSAVHGRQLPVTARLAALEAAAAAALRRSVDRRLADLEFNALRVLGGLR